jgi:hypothetical protein
MRIYIVAKRVVFEDFRVRDADERGPDNLPTYIHIGRSSQLRGIQLLKGDEIQVPHGLSHVSNSDYQEMREIINYKRSTQIHE